MRVTHGHAYRRMHATRNKETLTSRPELEATNILTFVNKLNADFSGSTFVKAYELLSERCHPNAAGTIGMFVEMDADSGIVGFSDRINKDWAFRLIYGIVTVVKVAELIFDQLDEALLKMDLLGRVPTKLADDATRATSALPL
jgi:hypothetical protein